jgi:DNA-binding IscR family transcriptional regulator
MTLKAVEVLTSRAKYAVRATMALAELKVPNVWTSATELAEAANVPRKFLEAILPSCASTTCWKAGAGRRAGIGCPGSRPRYRRRT